ncbi:hypothetical protein DSECCO2_661180 [anaerobic digester metagenome]
MVFSPRRYCMVSDKDVTGITVMSLIMAASSAFSQGTMRVSMPSRLAAIAMGKTPSTGRTLPSRESSPMRAIFFRAMAGIMPLCIRMDMAIGRSSDEESFLMSAGARLMV